MFVTNKKDEVQLSIIFPLKKYKGIKKRNKIYKDI